MVQVREWNSLLTLILLPISRAQTLEIREEKADITISTKDSHIVTYSAPLHAVKPWGGSEGMFGIHAHTIHRAICLVFCFIYLMNS